MNKIAIDYRNPIIIRKLGIEALSRELTPIGMACFFRQYEQGSGDYTLEKEKETENLTFEDYQKFVEQNKKSQASTI